MSAIFLFVFCMSYVFLFLVPPLPPLLLFSENRYFLGCQFNSIVSFAMFFFVCVVALGTTVLTC